MDKKKVFSLDNDQIDLVLKAFLMFFLFSFTTKFIGKYIKFVESFNLALDLIVIILLFSVRQYFINKNKDKKG